VGFNEEVPSSFALPNLIVVGVADAVGGEIFFTNYGKVDVFAEGFEVPSKAPGGSPILFTGTSAAAPLVTNLAAKLLAVKPTLRVAELRRAIVESADEKAAGPGRTIRLLNPKSAVSSVSTPSP
jgi:subtilisin family serine protease